MSSWYREFGAPGSGGLELVTADQDGRPLRVSDDDQTRAMREWAAQLSSEELEDVPHGILAGVSATDAAPHTPEMPTLPDPPEEPQALTVRVDIDETRPPVWRRLVLRGDLLLDELHAVLQAAFGWQDTQALVDCGASGRVAWVRFVGQTPC